MVWETVSEVINANLGTLNWQGSIFHSAVSSVWLWSLLFIIRYDLSVYFCLFRSYKSGSGVNNRRTELFLKEHEHLRRSACIRVQAEASLVVMRVHRTCHVNFVSIPQTSVLYFCILNVWRVGHCSSLWSRIFSKFYSFWWKKNAMIKKIPEY